MRTVSAPFGHLLLGKIEEETESTVDRLRILKGLSYVRVKENDIAALSVTLVVLAAHGPREVLSGSRSSSSDF